MFFKKSHKLSGQTVCQDSQMTDGGKVICMEEFHMEGMIELGAILLCL